MKKFISLLMAAALIFAIVACGAEGAGDSGSANKEDSGGQAGSGAPGGDSSGSAGGDAAHILRVWASQDDQDLTKDLINKFIAANPQYSVSIELGVVGEPDAFARFSEDPAAAADVFFFPDDQLRNFVRAGGLYEISRNVDDIIARNGDGSIRAASLNGTLYAYPATADNGYFLYYDKSVLSAEDVKSLDRILEVSEAAGKGFQFDIGNGWYIAAFFLGAGGTLSVTDDGKQICDFNNANGLGAAKAIQALTAHPAFLNGNDDVLRNGLGGSVAAGVSGTWVADDVAAALGSNYAATKLPTFTKDGQQVQMSSFGGYKLVGVNAMIDDIEKLVIAMDFADFLTNEESQITRFEERAMGPSNTSASANPAIMENVALAALAAQSAYAATQGDVLGEYWVPAGAFGTAMANGDTTPLQQLLDTMVAQITS